jgi:hypothetical protein
VLPIPNMQAQQVSRYFLNGGGVTSVITRAVQFIGVGSGPFLYERMPQGLKAIHFAGFMYELKPVPFRKKEVPQGLKPSLSQSVAALLKPCPSFSLAPYQRTHHWGAGGAAEVPDEAPD